MRSGETRFFECGVKKKLVESELFPPIFSPKRKSDSVPVALSLSLSNHATSCFADSNHTCVLPTAVATSKAAELADSRTPLPWRREKNLQRIEKNITI